MRRLKPLGIRARVGRNAALVELAADLPAVVISKLLGVSIRRATVWAQESGNTRPGRGPRAAARAGVRASGGCGPRAAAGPGETIPAAADTLRA